MKNYFSWDSYEVTTVCIMFYHIFVEVHLKPHSQYTKRCLIFIHNSIVSLEIGFDS